MKNYLQSCKSEFWQNVFKAELDYIANQLNTMEDVLSVGCGPAIIEAALTEKGFNVTGLDISEEALEAASDNIRKFAGSAEKMDFADCSFDAVIYVASMQFIEGYKQAVKETARVLRPDGKILAMLLNPDSEFFRAKINEPDSYINKIRHKGLNEIEKTIAEYFSVQAEYFLGIRGQDIFETANPSLASLYVINGKKEAIDIEKAIPR